MASLLHKLLRTLTPASNNRRRKPRKRPATPAPQPIEERLEGLPLEGIRHIRFGHYSDNNRTPAQKRLWGEAEAQFKEGRYRDSIVTLLRYLYDDREKAVSWTIDEEGKLHFRIAQGSSMVKGTFDGAFVHACVPLARTENPGTAVMRRLLELNYELRYTSVGMDEKGIFHFVFDTSAATASPEKLFEGLQELALKSDRQDDTLMTDFSDLEPMPRAPVNELPRQELEAKWKAFQRWTQHSLDLAASFDNDTYAGAIAHIYLTTVYKLDFLLSPVGKLMLELERISGLYWKQKEGTPLVWRNQQMRSALTALLGWNREDLSACLQSPRSTFALTDNPRPEKMRDNILTALRDAETYRSRQQGELALKLVAFGPLYNQYLYSLPDVVSNLTLILCAVLHPRYFADLGLKEAFCDPDTGKPAAELIKATVRTLIAAEKDTFPALALDLSKVNFSDRYSFAHSYAAQLAQLAI